MFKVIVAGSRKYLNYCFLEQKLDHLLQNVTEEIQIVSGCADGADSLGEKYATEKGYKIARFPAAWMEHGKGAGPIRNEEMARYADACVVFMIGKSRGSSDMIRRAKNHDLKLRVYEF